MQDMDLLVLNWLHLQRHALLDAFFRAITWAGSLSLLIPATIVLFIVLRRTGKGREARLFAFSMAFSVFSGYVVKFLAQRPRPEIHPAIIPLPADWSFPSGHATQITTFCLCAALLAMRNLPLPWNRLTVLLATGLIAGVGVSRIYLQVHYPTDVLAGILLGIVIVAATDRLLST